VSERRTSPGRKPDIVAAMSERGLFRRWFEGPSWDPWRAVLRGTFALPMSAEERAFFRTVAERDPPSGPVREAWFICGRGAGKDSVASLIAAYTAALFKPVALRPGERALVACLACDRDQARIVLGYTGSFFCDVPPLRAMVQRETAAGFELSNKVDIAIATNSFRSIRGRSTLCAILDECAFYRDERSANPDEELLAALMPGLARVPGSILIGISTPHRKAGLLYRKFTEHFGRSDSDVLVIRAPSLTMNPTLDRAIIDQALQDDPALARAEWLSEWREDISGWASRELIEAAVDRSVAVRPPRSGTSYSSFCDPSGGQGDSFTAAIAHKEDDAAVLDRLIEIRPPFNSETATAEIATALKQYNCHHTIGDKYGANWVVDAFRRYGIRYEHSEPDRSQIYLDVLPLFTAGRIRLLDSKRLVHQFASLERRAGSLGRDKVDHPRGAHDDLCNSAAGALVRSMSARAPMKVTQQILDRMGPAGGGRFGRSPDAYNVIRGAASMQDLIRQGRA